VSKISDIIEINISRETAAVARESFNIPLFLAAHTAFSERAREYADPDEVLSDFKSTSNVYKACTKLFGQEIKPPKVIVGRKQVDSVTGSIATLSANTVYTLTINGTPISVTSDASPTAVEICAALRSAFTSTSVVGVSMTDNLNGTFSVAVSTPGSAWSVTASANVTLISDVSTEAWADSINAVEEENSEWYALTAETHSDEDILAIAESIEARKNIYGASSASSTIKTSATSDIASKLEALGYQRTFLMYLPTADSEFPECAWIGGQLPETPGSNTWKFKELIGVTVSKLSSTEQTNCRNKKCNTFQRVSGRRIAREGYMVGGEWIDIIIFSDWLEARIGERLYFRLVNSKKIPYTAAGLTIIQGEILAVLQEGILAGGLSPNPKPKVTLPDIHTVDPNLKALRTVEGIKFEGTLANAIHFLKIQGTISY
jgi:hypothetical protein